MDNKKTDCAEWIKINTIFVTGAEVYLTHAMFVGVGCLVTVTGPNYQTSITFVPGVTIVGGKLVPVEYDSTIALEE